MNTSKLLDQVIGAQPNLAKVAQGYGRVATTAHPQCTCRTSWASCPQWSNGFGARYLRTKVLQPDVAAVVTAARQAVTA